jgi:hypothetical protein
MSATNSPQKCVESTKQQVVIPSLGSDKPKEEEKENLQQLMKSKGVLIVWYESLQPGAKSQRLSPFPRAAAAKFSGLCAQKHAGRNSTIPTIYIRGGSFEHIHQVFRWIVNRCHGVEGLPSLGNKPFYNAFRLNEAARILRVHPLADDLWKEIKRLQKPITNIKPSPEDVKAVMAAFPQPDSRRQIVILVLAAAISNGLISETSAELVALKEKDKDFAESLSKILVSRQEWVEGKQDCAERLHNHLKQRQEWEQDRIRRKNARMETLRRDQRAKGAVFGLFSQGQASAEFDIGTQEQYDSDFPSLGQ